MTPSEMLKKLESVKAEVKLLPPSRIVANKCYQCQCELNDDEIWRCTRCIKGETTTAAQFTTAKQVYREDGQTWLLDLLERKICPTCGNTLYKLRSTVDEKKTFYSCEEDIANHRWCLIDGKEPTNSANTRWNGM